MKMIGLILLALVPTVIGFYRGEELRKILKIQMGFLQFFREIEQQISLFSREQQEIFANFQNKSLEDIGFLSHLREEVRKEPCGAIHRVIHAFPLEKYFGETQRDYIYLVCERFGMLSREAQLQDLSKLILLLSKEEDTAKEITDGKIRIARTVGMTAGLGLIILLI